jgi:hypothetical protein
MKLKKVLVSVEFCKMIMSGKKQIFQVIENCLPQDTKLIRVGMSDQHQTAYLIIQSEEFDNIPEGHEIPDYIPKITSYYMD